MDRLNIADSRSLLFCSKRNSIRRPLFDVRTLSLVFLALILPASSLFAQISNPKGGLQQVPSDMIWAQTLEGSYFNEFWNYQFYMDNGMKVHITFSAANFGGLKSPVTGVRVSVLYSDGKVYQLSREYDINHLLQDRENHLFRVRPERELWFKGELPYKHRVFIKTSKDGVSYDIDLELSNIVPGLQIGEGIYKIEQEPIGILAHIPYAKVRGRVAINENDQQVSGTAYMDHTFQNQTTTRLMDSGYRLVSHGDEKNWDILYFLLPDGSTENRTIGYFISNRDDKLTSSAVRRISEMHSGSAFGRSIARIIMIELENGKSIRLQRNEDLEKFSILDELGWVARRAARTFLGGEVINFRGTATLYIPSQRPKSAEYNFFIVD